MAYYSREDTLVDLPDIGQDESFISVVKKLSVYITDAISVPSTFEQLRTTSAGNEIRALVDYIVTNVTNPAILNALLTLKWHFSTLEPDDRGLNETRANACEIVSWRFLSRLAERDAIDYVLYELPAAKTNGEHIREATDIEGADERSTLLPQFRERDHPELAENGKPLISRLQLLRDVTQMGTHLFSAADADEDEEEETIASFTGLNALEIAAVADAKKFLSQGLVQKIIYGIWTGEITFWESLSVHTKKKAQFYNKQKADPFSRLRVPKYIKAFEVFFFATFLGLYYAVLVERNPYSITALEVFLYIWLAAFAYDEMSEFMDAGLFYYADFWSSWDLAIILNGVAFLITRIVGLMQNNDRTIDIAFDILSLEALFLVPRICSLLSLHPYFGTLIPCLKEMTKDFIKFMSVVAILYIGFLTTFSLLARDHFTLSQMSWILIKVFFGSSYIGFDIMLDISPQLGPPLMLIFVCMTNILLITSLISILSNSFSKVTAHAREEYLFVYSVYVLEASTSNRLTHFYPPLNLIPLILIRPLRLCVSADRVRALRIILLKVTHTPIVGAIILYEALYSHFYGRMFTWQVAGGSGPAETSTSKANSSSKRDSCISTPLKRPGLSVRPDTAGSTVHPPTQRPDSRRSDNGLGRQDSIIRRKDHRGRSYLDGGNSDEQTGLEAKVEDLSRKIEELTALILAQQGTSSGAAE